MKRAALLALTLTACSAAAPDAPQTPAPTSAPTAAPKIEQQQLGNTGWLDVATFASDPPALPAVISTEVLLGVELLARPFVLECLVDPTHRGADKRTHAVIDASLGDGGVTHKVSGDNMTPAGTKCIEAALGKWTASMPALNAKAAAGAGVSAHIEIDHVAGVQPAVVFGQNEGSDVAGTIRLAVAGWGDCFTAWKSAPPRQLKGSLELTKPAQPADKVAP
ncbi:MAG: hypothetical protein U0359_42305, partial [Byssovorax sp.]